MKKGFTLIELLIGITVMSIVFTIGFASYRDFSRRQALVGISKTLMSDLRNIQQMASSGQKPNGCTQLDGYSFVIVGTGSYKLIANCINIVNLTIKEVFLPTGATISGSNTQFKALGQGTNLTTNNVITISSTISNSTSTITIGAGGDIK